MIIKKYSNIIWVNFKAKKIESDKKITQPIPYLCSPQALKKPKGGHQ